MTPSMVYVIESLDAIKFVGEIDKKSERAMVRALNKTGPHARKRADEEVRDQVNFPASYLRPSTGRLVVAKKASAGQLETVIRGRGRPTSLARFITSDTPAPGRKKMPRKNPEGKINVEVKPGRINTISRAWVISLPGSPDSRNLGLAVRTSGGKPKNAYAPKPLTKMGPNVWLLYGPSVDQVLYSARNGGGVVTQIEGEVLQHLSDEYSRLMDLELK